MIAMSMRHGMNVEAGLERQRNGTMLDNTISWVNLCCVHESMAGWQDDSINDRKR